LDDPTVWIPTRSDSKKSEAVRVGVAHGSLRDRENLSPDDHLIALDAAHEHELDYLALGHWHSTHEYKSEDGAFRTAYPGVPEPLGYPNNVRDATGWLPYSGNDPRGDFADDGHGKVLRVKIAGPGAPPEIEPIEVGVLRWESELSRAHSESDISEIIRRTAERPDPVQTVLKLGIEGVLPGAAWVRLDELREILRGRYVHGELDLSSLRIQPTEQEIRETVGQGVLKAVFDRLSQGIVAPATVAGAPEEDKRAGVAERAMALLYQIALEVRQ
jgi:DNA repair exonuclease SbcCD nuclease subunit